MAKLDAIDLRILAELQKDARLTAAQLAEKVGLSTTPCWRRVKKLEEDGVIMRYVALVDPSKVDLGDSVFVQINLEKHAEVTLDSFAEKVAAFPEVMECWLIAGDSDYLLRIAASGSRGYERFLKDQLLQLPGIAHCKSSFTLKQVKYETALPLERIEKE